VKKLKSSIYLLSITIAIGILGFHFIEGVSIFDAFYMTIITISTVGFQEVFPLSIWGRILTVFVIVCGISIGGYTIGTLMRMFIEGELKKSFGRRKLEKKISQLKNHYIICGYGRIGYFVCKELRKANRDFVVIENQPEAIEQLEEARILFMPVDATEDDSLIKAGIMKASAIVTAVGSDSDNVFITLTAKGLRPDLFILARASDENNIKKLKRAGATRVVSPYVIGGKRMAQVLIRPAVVDFIDIAIMGSGLGLQMEEFRIRPESSLVGKNIIDSNLRKNYGVIVVLIKKNNGDLIYNPQPQEILEANDILVLIGKSEDMKKMSENI
jgi:voltage-gated potassium channel